ncbi:hypothetical protein [Arthrobacter sp. M4]|uniref:hypothetical protein n=1 Tax=Arthrobacter sp. M4 TaxID=218160 RepID=UPI001CDBC3D5|nr:hypothetical protein [Arthrobacter sp. M4]MCA4135036.1 hypothetical protein [Arthrobacter sp. M4]
MALAAAGVVAAALIFLDISAPGLSIFKLVVCLVVPGWAVIRMLPESDPAARLVWTAVTSAGIYTVLALAMAWTAFWQPRPAAAVTVLAGSACTVFIPVNQRRREPATAGGSAMRFGPRNLPGVLSWGVLAVAVGLWAGGLFLTDATNLGELGLLERFPLIWYVGVCLTLILCIWGVAGKRVASRPLLSASVGSLVVMLYGSASILSEVPRLPWTYKHIAVTDFIGAAGHVDPSIDIYNRWPGFFSLSAFLGETSGYRDALAYARWAEISYALVDVVVVLAIARVLSKNPRVYWTAALVFALTNWVNQNYYSPQAFSFTLYLSMCLIALTFLRGTPVKWVVAIERRLRRRRLHVVDDLTDHREHSVPRIPAIVVILLLQAVVATSHQLTPYLAVLGLFPLFVLGYFRPKWLGPALFVIALAYLLPNFDYVESKYGLFSGFDVLSNASISPPQSSQLTQVDLLQARGTQVLSVLTALLAICGFARRMVRGEIRTTLLVAWMAVAPVLGLIGQSYGGEGRFRVYLFALPWLSIGVAWLFWSGPIRKWRAVVAASVSLVLMGALFVAIYFQPEAGNRISVEEATAGDWLDNRVKPGDLIFETNYFFPLLIGPNYPNYLEFESITSLSGSLKNSNGNPTVNDVLRFARKIRGTDTIYVVMSDRQARNAAERKLFPPGTLTSLENSLAGGSNVAKVFDNKAVRIYQISTAG